MARRMGRILGVSEGDELIGRAELRRPRALERAILPTARGTSYLLVELEVLALLPGIIV